VGALRVHPYKHCANYPPQKIEECGGARIPSRMKRPGAKFETSGGRSLAD